jgi:hypothetical protein
VFSGQESNFQTEESSIGKPSPLNPFYPLPPSALGKKNYPDHFLISIQHATTQQFLIPSTESSKKNVVEILINVRKEKRN